MSRLSVLAFVFAIAHGGLNIHGSLVVQRGGSVLLPCYIKNPLLLEGLQVKWRKMDSVVSLHQQGKSRADLQSPEFRGRVDFFPDEFAKGNFSVLMKNVDENDAGVYTCIIDTTDQQISSEALIEIQDIKHFVVTGTDRDIFAYKGDDVVLNCSVDSHLSASDVEEVTWKKTETDQDVLVLFYRDTEIFPDASHQRYRGRVDLFASEIPKGNFSLKLKDVKMEDKGEFVCEVQIRNTSGRTTVVVKGVGFSALHISLLMLCLVAFLLSVGFCGPVYNLLKNKAALNTHLRMHFVLVLCPNICMFVAFCLWSTEGILPEVVTCSVVSIIRPVMLMKTSPYLTRYPKHLQNAAKALALPLYNSIKTISAISFFFANIGQMQTTTGCVVIILTLIALVSFITAALLALNGIWIRLIVSLDLLNTALFGLLLSSTKDYFEYILEIPSVVPPLIMATMMVFTLQKYFFQGKPFDCFYATLSSVIVAILSLSEICIYFIFFIMSKDFSRGWTLIIEAVVFICAWLVVFYLSRCYRGRSHGCYSQWRKIGYISCLVTAAFLIIAYGVYMCVRYKNIFREEKDAAGYVTLLVFIHILAATCLNKHPKYLPYFLHIMIYMFGAVGLSSVNALALASELILKSDEIVFLRWVYKRTEDGRSETCVWLFFSLETLFLSAWLALQIYSSWMSFKDRTKHHFVDEKERGHEVLPEMAVLSKP